MIPSFIKVPNTPLKLAKRLGLGSLRRHKKDGHVSGLSHMIASIIYSMPSDYQIMKTRLLVLAIILLAPEGAGLFMYIFLWLIIPVESDKERNDRTSIPKLAIYKAKRAISKPKKRYKSDKWNNTNPWHISRTPAPGFQNSEYSKKEEMMSR